MNEIISLLGIEGVIGAVCLVIGVAIRLYLWVSGKNNRPFLNDFGKLWACCMFDQAAVLASSTRPKQVRRELEISMKKSWKRWRKEKSDDERKRIESAYQLKVELYKAFFGKLPKCHYPKMLENANPDTVSDVEKFKYAFQSQVDYKGYKVGWRP